MRKISLLISISLILIVVVSCAAQITDEELEAELAKLTPEEREQLLKDLENEKGAFAGQAIAKYSSKLAGVPKARVQAAASKGCTDSGAKCPQNYVCENSKCVPLRKEPQAPVQLSAGPQVFNTKFYQSPVRADPDDLLLIPGYGFEQGAIVVYKSVSDTPANLQPPAAIPNTNTAAVGKLYIGGITTDSISVLLPKEMTAKQTYALWVKNPNSDWSEAILINDPRPLWVTPGVAYATQKFAALPREIKLVGRNLEHKFPVAAAPAQLRLVGSETYTLFVIGDNDPGTTIEHYAAKAALPASMQPGIYSVQYSRSGADWIDLPTDATFTVLPDPQPKQSFDISSYGCSADDGLDDTACIVQAINAANTAGGGEVFFPQGTWEIGDVSSISAMHIYQYHGIIVPQGVDLVGAGAEQTIVKQTLNWKEPKVGVTNVFSVFTLLGSNEIRNIHFHSEGYNLPLQQTPTFFSLGKLVHISSLSEIDKGIEEVIFSNNKFDDMYYTIGTRGLSLKKIFIVNNEFQPFALSLYLTGNRFAKNIKFKVEDLVIVNNTFFPGDYASNDQGTMVSAIGGARRVDLSSNVADGTVNGGWRAAFFLDQLGTNEKVLISNNKATCTGDKTGDGESIVVDDNGNVLGFSEAQQVAAATVNTVSVNGDWLETTPDFYKEHWAFISDGKGLGQARKIVDYTMGNPVLITVSPAWDVIPDSSSKVSVTRSSWNTYMIDNIIDIRGCLKSNPYIDQSGILGWAATIADSTIEGNKLYDTSGIIASISSRPNITFRVTYASEIRNNLIDGEYKYPNSIGGINLWSSSTANYPSPVVGYNVLVSHNSIRTADTVWGGGIGIIPSGPRPTTPIQWREILLFHNTLESISSSGINIFDSYTWNAVLYKNVFTAIDPNKEIIDKGTNTVIIP